MARQAVAAVCSALGDCLLNACGISPLRITWILLRSDGSECIRGMGFGELVADGRVRRIVDFVGALPLVCYGPAEAISQSPLALRANYP